MRFIKDVLPKFFAGATVQEENGDSQTQGEEGGPKNWLYRRIEIKNKEGDVLVLALALIRERHDSRHIVADIIFNNELLHTHQLKEDAEAIMKRMRDDAERLRDLNIDPLVKSNLFSLLMMQWLQKERIKNNPI